MSKSRVDELVAGKEYKYGIRDQGDVGVVLLHVLGSIRSGHPLLLRMPGFLSG